MPQHMIALHEAMNLSYGGSSFVGTPCKVRRRLFLPRTQRLIRACSLVRGWPQDSGSGPAAPASAAKVDTQLRRQARCASPAAACSSHQPRAFSATGTYRSSQAPARTHARYSRTFMNWSISISLRAFSTLQDNQYDVAIETGSYIYTLAVVTRCAAATKQLLHTAAWDIDVLVAAGLPIYYAIFKYTIDSIVLNLVVYAIRILQLY